MCCEVGRPQGKTAWLGEAMHSPLSLSTAVADHIWPQAIYKGISLLRSLSRLCARAMPRAVGHNLTDTHGASFRRWRAVAMSGRKLCDK